MAGTGGGGSPNQTIGAGGEGGQNGAGGAGPTPAECFAIHDEEACLSSGCDFFVRADTFSIADGVCQASDDVGYCFRFLEEPTVPAPCAMIRDFSAEGPQVLGFGSFYPLMGWHACGGVDADVVAECCCYSYWSTACDGITPVDLSGD